jgi:hypothetical protein
MATDCELQRLQTSAAGLYLRRLIQTSCLHCASIVSKTLFIIPTDAHYYKIIETLKQF